MFSLDQVTSVEDVKVGNTLYHVWGATGTIHSHTILEEPFPNEYTTSYFVKNLHGWPSGGVYDDKNSLMDMGIIPNEYNQDKTFFTRESAEKYADNLRIQNRIWYPKN